MSLKNHIIMGLHITNRVQHVAPIQHLLTEYGCSIRTRLGLHEVEKDFCSPNGVLLLEMTDDRNNADELMTKLNKIEGIESKIMTFDHP